MRRPARDGCDQREPLCGGFVRWPNVLCRCVGHKTSNSGAGAGYSSSGVTRSRAHDSQRPGLELRRSSVCTEFGHVITPRGRIRRPDYARAGVPTADFSACWSRSTLHRVCEAQPHLTIAVVIRTSLAMLTPAGEWEAGAPHRGRRRAAARVPASRAAAVLSDSMRVAAHTCGKCPGARGAHRDVDGRPPVHLTLQARYSISRSGGPRKRLRISAPTRVLR